MLDYFKKGSLVSEIRNVTNVGLQNSNLWELVIQGYEKVKYKVQSVTLPFLKLNTETRKIGTKHYISYTPEEDFNISFLETTEFEVLNFLQNWKDDIFDKEKRVFNVGDFSKTFILRFQVDTVTRFFGPFMSSSRDNNKAFQLNKVKLKSVENFDLNYTSTDPLIITASFTCDKIVELPPGQANFTSIRQTIETVFGK